MTEQHAHAEAPLLATRAQFPILEHSTYLVSHSLGAMPRSVPDKLGEFSDLWATRGVRAWAEGWWDLPLTVGDQLATIIGAPPGTVAMHQNVSVCQSILMSCLEPTPRRNRVVLNELEFPTVMYVYEAHARGRDIEVVTVPSPDGMTIPTEAMLAAIDERTLVVPISHVLFKSSYLQDVRAIVARAKEVGAFVVLDTYQSAGIVPLDLEHLDVDAATGGSVKWLCGGPGAGYLYVHPRWHDKLEPRVTGWMAHADPFAFEPGAPCYTDGIARFLHGSPGVPALYSAQVGYAIVAELGVERIRAKNLRQSHVLFDLADAAGIRVSSPRDDDRRGGTVTLDVEHAAAVTRALGEQEILVDYRPGAGIRMSPHFYTTDDELRLAMDAIVDIVGTGSWRNHDLAGAAY